MAIIVTTENTMEISKVGNEFNTYKIALSYGELIALQKALQVTHAGPVADEALQAISWYLERVPEPGSEETKLRSLDDDEDEDGEDEGGEADDAEVSDELELGEPGEEASPATGNTFEFSLDQLPDPKAEAEADEDEPVRPRR